MLCKVQLKITEKFYDEPVNFKEAYYARKDYPIYSNYYDRLF